MSFNAKVSDPRIGGTYMTMLNTLANLGGNWPNTVAMWFADTKKLSYCEGSLANSQFCNDNSTITNCESLGGVCRHMTIDGYYVITAVSVVLGFLWLAWKSKTLKKLQLQSPESWKTD